MVIKHNIQSAIVGHSMMQHFHIARFSNAGDLSEQTLTACQETED